jgi:hypothetical protein
MTITATMVADHSRATATDGGDEAAVSAHLDAMELEVVEVRLGGLLRADRVVEEPCTHAAQHRLLERIRQQHAERTVADDEAGDVDALAGFRHVGEEGVQHRLHVREEAERVVAGHDGSEVRLGR